MSLSLDILFTFTYKYSEPGIKGMRGFLVGNICVFFGDQVFQQSVGIPLGTNCAPLLADLFLYSYESEFVHRLLQDKNKNLQPYMQIYWWCPINQQS
jgi:hypothetical protein